MEGLGQRISGGCGLITSVVIWVCGRGSLVSECGRGVNGAIGKRRCRGGGRFLYSLPLGSCFGALGPGVPLLSICFLEGVTSGCSKLTVFAGRSEHTKGFQSMSPISHKETMATMRGSDHIKRGDVMEGNRYFP